MPEISRIEYIVHPLWQYARNEQGCVELINRIMLRANDFGSDEKRLFLLENNSLESIRSTLSLDGPLAAAAENGSFQESWNKTQTGYYSEIARLSNHLSLKCNNYYIGPVPASLNGDVFHNFFQDYLKHHKVNFNRSVRVYGHGSERGACVEQYTFWLVNALHKQKIDASMVICDFTTL